MITVYTTGESCRKCHWTIQKFTDANVPHVVVDITDAPAAREYVTEDLGYSRAPVVVVDENDHWSDLRPDHIDRIIRLFGAEKS